MISKILFLLMKMSYLIFLRSTLFRILYKLDTARNFYYSVENCGFKPRPFRTQGTYSKYNSIDDKMDDLHFYTLFTKFGIGRATYDVSQEIRNDHLNQEEVKN